MIPQEKIDKASGYYRDGLLREARRNTGLFVGVPNTAKHINAMADGFADGYNHALIDYQSIAIEFVEWVHKNCSALCGTLWEFGKYPNSKACTSSELFAKFMAERGQG